MTKWAVYGVGVWFWESKAQKQTREKRRAKVDFLPSLDGRCQIHLVKKNALNGNKQPLSRSACQPLRRNVRAM